jgi:hypothetical protein
LLEQVREALIGLAEREIPGDPIPCFCVEYRADTPVHDQWCEAARIALSESSDVGPELDDDANVVIPLTVQQLRRSGDA